MLRRRLPTADLAERHARVLEIEVGVVLHQLTIAPGLRAVTIVDGCGNRRTFDTSDRVQDVEYGTVRSQVMTRWKGPTLVQNIAVNSDESIVLSLTVEDNKLVVTEVVHASGRPHTTLIYRYTSDALR